MEISEMSKIIGAVAITGMVVAIVAWSRIMVIKPEAAAAAAEAAAADGGPIISPFETMIKHGKNLPAEDWRPAN
jgi:hypothetical protein